MEAAPSLGLKRRYEEVDNGSPFSDDDVSSSDSADSCDSLNAPSGATLIRKDEQEARANGGEAPGALRQAHRTPLPFFSPSPAASILRRHKPPAGGKRVRFDAVTVYYFARRQGFTSVPSQGGSSLGMARRHSSIRRYTLGEFAHEREASRRHTLLQHLRREKLNARKMTLTRNGTVECAQADLLTLDDVSDEDLDVDGVVVDDCFFLQPLPTKRRRALLRASGVARIDVREKGELRAIRLSREECGCSCRLYCDPRHCGCSQAGIKCQVDRMSFPCGCSRDGCENAAGRIEYNPLRVRTHYLHTVMKLDPEKRRMLIQGTGHPYADADPLSSPSSTCPAASPYLSSATGPDAAELRESELQAVAAERDILERENETAVLHLQSAEEQERREREEAEGEAVRQDMGAGGVAEQPLCLVPGALGGELPGQAGAPGAEQVLLRGPFPTGATVLCIADNQEDGPSDLLRDSGSLLYYQLSPVEPGTFGTLPREEDTEQRERLDTESDSGGGGGESKHDDLEGITCRRSSAKSLADMILCSEDYVEAEEERPPAEAPRGALPAAVPLGGGSPSPASCGLA